MIGRTVSHYEIVSRLGSGGMGDVYRARDTRLDRTVVLKFLPPARADDAAARARFLREAKAASRLDHASICTIYDIDELEDGTQFISMAHCDGENLADRLASGPLPVAEATRIALRVAEGLMCAHERGVIHRDLKPANVQLTRQGEVKILDFGVARLAGQERLTVEGTAVGTLPYMAPEQTQGNDVDLRSDLWSLGVLLYEMLTGQRPFRGETQAELLRAIVDEPTPDVTTLAPHVPAELVHLLGWCLEKEPDRRPECAADLVQPLSMLARLTSDDVTAAITSAVGQTPGRRRGPWLAGGAVLVATILILARALWPVAEARQGMALLPWAVIGGDLDDQRLGDGMVEHLTSQLLLIEPAQPGGWVAPSAAVRKRDITSTDRARGRLGVSRVVSGTLHINGDALRLELLLHDTGVAGGDLTDPPQRRIVEGARANLVAWTDEVLVAVVDLVGWRLAGGVGPAAASATHSDAALALYLQGLGMVSPFAGRAKDRAGAAESFTLATTYDPDFAASRVWLGRLHLVGIPPDGVPDLDAALAASRAAADLAPRFLDAYFLRGRVLLARRDPEAKAAFQRCQRLVPGHWLSLAWLSDAYLQVGAVDSAEATLRAAVANRPDDPMAQLQLGNLLYSEGRLDGAAAHFERVVELAPDNVDGFVNLGSVAYQKENWEDAAAMYQRALAIEPDATTYQNLGTVYFYQHRLADAGRMYEMATRMLPADPQTLGWAAECYWWSGVELDRARELYARAAVLADSLLAVRPGNLELAVNLASYHVRLDHRAKALELLAEVAAANPRDLNIRYMLATCYEDLGDRDRALEHLELALRGGYPRRSLEVNPGFDQLRQSPEYAALLARIDGDGQ